MGKAIESLKGQGIEHVSMLSGDSMKGSERGNSLGLDSYHAELLRNKLSRLEELMNKASELLHIVVMA
jgi:cation transport ATPase